MLAVRANQYVWAGPRQATVAALVKALGKRAWHKLTIAEGGKGPRRYARAWLAIQSDLGPAWRRWLLVRKGPDGREDLANYIAARPARTTLTRLARSAGVRWSIEAAMTSAIWSGGYVAGLPERGWSGKAAVPWALKRATLL